MTRLEEIRQGLKHAQLSPGVDTEDIRWLLAEVEGLREALKVFAGVAGVIHPNKADTDMMFLIPSGDGIGVEFWPGSAETWVPRVADYRRAAEVLKRTPEPTCNSSAR